jgi:hypothetical protein
MIDPLFIQLQLLKTEMIIEDLNPEEELIADSERHFYSIKHDGKKFPAWYLITPYLHETEGPVLICQYGRLDMPNNTFRYSSLSNN